MGWTSLHREAGLSNADFFRDLLGSDQRMLAHHTERRSTFYAAIEDVRTGEVWALVALLRWQNDHFNFSYKTMSDSCGPVMAEAPARVLDLLTPTENEEANRWRTACRRRLEVREANRAALADGVQVRLPRPLRFSDGSTRDTFTYRRCGRSSGLYADGMRFRIPGWRDLELEVTAPAA